MLGAEGAKSKRVVTNWKLTQLISWTTEIHRQGIDFTAT